MKILIAGFGSIGRRHFRNLLALGERQVVFYRSQRSTLPDDELAGFPVETQLEAALAHRPDAVLVATPTALHLDLAIPAARAGCALFIEKPLSDSLDRLPELQQALAQGSGPLLVGFHFRFHPGLQTARRLLDQGLLGRVISAHAHWGEYLPDWHPWEDFRQGYAARAGLGGGVVRTLSHPLDYLRWLLGEVEQAWAFTGRLSGWGLDVEDTAEIGLRFAGGALGSVHLDYLQRPPAHRLEIVGSQGTLQWDYADGAVRLWTAAEGRWQAFLPPPGFERNCLFLDEMRHFLAVARGQAQPICTLNDGLRVQQLVQAVIDGDARGGPPEPGDRR